MLYAVIGKPGEGKSYWCVSEMYEKQQTNLANIKTNVKTYYENKDILKDRGHDIDSNNEYTFQREINVKENGLLIAKVVDWTFKYNEFQEFEEEEQFEVYFELAMLYNDFIDHINKLNNITLAKLLPVQQIYSDINGLKIDGVLPLPSLDWRVTPLGSIHYIDEIRKKAPYKYDGKNPSKDQIIIDMAEVRHYDKDIYLISQDAKDLNISLHQLLDKLYFIKRPAQKPQACSLYVFDKYISNPRAGADSTREPKPYVEHRLIVYKKKIFKMYKSASSHTSMKFSINWKVFMWLLLLLSLIGFTLYGINKIPFFGQLSNTFAAMTGQSPLEDIGKNALIQNGSKEPVSQATTDQQTAASEPTTQTQTSNNADKVRYQYDVSKPYDTNYQIEYELNERPRLAGCIASKKTCSCYTQQATKIDMSYNDCKRYISGDRPFDYFTKQQEQRQQQQQQTAFQQTNIGQQNASNFDQEYIAKMQEAKKQGLI